MKDFKEAFPLVQLRLSVEFFQGTAAALQEGWADLALMAATTPQPGDLERLQCGEIELVAVAAPDHPLAQIKRPFAPELLRDHLQLVLSSRAEVQDRRDYGVLAVKRWRVTDINLRHKLLLAGIGWCSMPLQTSWPPISPRVGWSSLSRCAGRAPTGCRASRW